MRIDVVLLAGGAAALTDIEHKPLFRKNIDPIVLPGKYSSHMHSFYGSDIVTKDLPTTAELQKGCPSGENPNDLSVYCASIRIDPLGFMGRRGWIFFSPLYV